MKYYIIGCVAGFIAFSEELEIIDYELFNELDIANQLLNIREGNIAPQEIELIRRVLKLSEESDSVVVEPFIKQGKYKSLEFYDKLIFEIPTVAGDYLRLNLKKVLSEISFLKIENYNENSEDHYLNEIIINNYKKIALEEMKESSQEEDKLLIQAINSIDEIDESISKLIERIREWYAIYFPEMDAVRNQEVYVDLIARITDREKIIEEEFDKFNIETTISHGADVKIEDLEILKNFAESIRELQESRKSIEKYISIKMDKLAPNLTHLIGSSLGAKLIAHTGSIKRLATHPSSTVQIIGAEKALFRHLKTGENPPKHGLIYQHPKIRGSKWWLRGKIARTLSLKISLAIRKDLFTGELDKSISESFLKRVEEIEKENPFPKRVSNKNSTRNKKSKKGRKKGKKRNKQKYRDY